MNLKTRFNLWKLKREMNPSMAFKAGLRKDLNVAWDARYGSKAPWYHLGMMRTASAFSAIVLLLTGGGGVYAYNNPEVTEGSPLYPIKQAIETVEEVIKTTPEAKAKFYLKKIERREAERAVLERKHKITEVKSEVEVKDIQAEIKLEVKAEVKDEVVKRKIKRTQKAIEKTEEELEKTRQIIEKTQSKDIKLREELKKRAEHKLEERKKQLEIKIENQKDKQESLQEIRLNNNGNKIKERSRVKIEAFN